MRQINLYLSAALLANLAGVGGISLLIALPVGANPTDNYNSSTLKSELAQQRTSPRPSILLQCPYNPAACTGGSSTPSPTQTPSFDDTKNVVEILESNPSFTLLVRALKAVQLEKVLQGEGPFTLFAPTDEAFNQLPQSTLEDLFRSENKEVLIKILRYHIVPGAILTNDLQSGEINSIEGGAIIVKVESGIVTVNDGNVVQADIQASNGYIHGINTVMLPPDL